MLLVLGLTLEPTARDSSLSRTSSFTSWLSSEAGNSVVLAAVMMKYNVQGLKSQRSMDPSSIVLMMLYEQQRRGVLAHLKSRRESGANSTEGVS